MARAKTSLSEFGVVAWGLGVYAATRLAGILLESASLASMLAQAILAEWGTGRMGVAWTNPKDSPNTTKTSRRIVLGAAFGFGAAAITVGFLVASRAVLLARANVALASMALALVTSGLEAVRSELLFRGIILRALEGTRATTLLKVIACGIVGAAAAIGDPGAALRPILVELVLGMGFGTLWIHDRGAWMAASAHAAWLFALGLLLKGGLFDAQVASSSWGGGDAGALGGSAAVVAVLPIATASFAWSALATRRAPGVR
ncbi:MAG: CPBP family glutamic-type intramembrane protease [Polyangiaceae bacterium]|nr:CPBP family glutamic-type intramembrane protease [Polyangiaceae bacterium]